MSKMNGLVLVHRLDLPAPRHVPEKSGNFLTTFILQATGAVWRNYATELWIQRQQIQDKVGVTVGAKTVALYKHLHIKMLDEQAASPALLDSRVYALHQPTPRHFLQSASHFHILSADNHWTFEKRPLKKQSQK